VIHSRTYVGNRARCIRFTALEKTDSGLRSTRVSSSRFKNDPSPFDSELKSAFRSPRSQRPSTAHFEDDLPVVSQVILSICPSEGFRWHRRKSAPIAECHGNFRLHLELIDFGDFRSELEDDFCAILRKFASSQRPLVTL